MRLGQRSLRLFDADNNRIALDQLVLTAGSEGIDQPVVIGRTGVPSLQARLIAVRLPQQAAERNRRKLQRAGQQEGYTPSEAAQVTAGHMVLLTSLSEKDASASSLIALYRLRWQIELAINRMKSLGNLDRLPAKTEKLASAWLHANLIGTLLTENLAAAVLDSPPSGPGRQTQTSLNLAPRG